MDDVLRQVAKYKKMIDGRGKNFLVVLSISMLMGGGSAFSSSAVSSGTLYPDQQTRIHSSDCSSSRPADDRGKRVCKSALAISYRDFYSATAAPAAVAALESSTPVSSEDAFYQFMRKSNRDHTMACLAINIYWEARNQNVSGQLAVAQVTMNRVNDSRYPDNVCEVVYDYKQFSWYWDGKPDRPKNKKAWEKAMMVASAVLDGSGHTELQGVTHYHAVYIQPYWQSHMTMITMIGDHVFYVE